MEAGKHSVKAFLHKGIVKVRCDSGGPGLELGKEQDGSEVEGSWSAIMESFECELGSLGFIFLLVEAMRHF